ncbi:MAG: hypothetical protein M1838_000835 [Thelocarpon superellum]|nr:MAG: hypothetical protein M1838_000835 [Thelocarpon superellum]
MSDLHLEAGRQYTTFDLPTRAPYLILAGDIGRLADYDLYLDFLRRVGLRLATSSEKEPALSSKLVILHRTRVSPKDLLNITIPGCTLQSHILPEACKIVEAKVNDFRRIQDWTVDNHNAEHQRDVEWLAAEITSVRGGTEGQRQRICVVTHHAPTIHGSSKPEHLEHPWSWAFGTDLLGDNGPAALRDVQWWIFRHTQFTTSFTQGQVKLVSNQRDDVLPKLPEQDERQISTWHTTLERARLLGRPERGAFDVTRVIKISTLAREDPF